MITKNEIGISIITVVYNSVKTIESTILSVINQTYKNLEYVVIDGASTDGTVNIIKKYEKNITHWKSEPDKGIYDAMNKGIAVSTGDYLYFLNSDDYLLDNFVIEEVARFLINNPRDIVYGSVMLVYGIYKIQKKYDYRFTKKNLVKALQPHHQATFMKRDVIIALNKFNPAYKTAADFDLFCKAFKNGYTHCFFDRIISVFNCGGAGSRDNTIWEISSIIKEYFGSFYSNKFFLVKFLYNKVKSIAAKTGVLNVYHRIKKLQLL